MLRMAAIIFEVNVCWRVSVSKFEVQGSCRAARARGGSCQPIGNACQDFRDAQLHVHHYTKYTSDITGAHTMVQSDNRQHL